jgi:short-subunit dehydrogenase
MAFAGKVVVITGASSGIGWALAKELAARQCKVGLVARRGDRLEALASEIRQAGGTAEAAAADVAEREPTLDAIRKIRDTLGPVDILVANAGVGAPTHLDPMNVPQIEQMFRVNVFGVVYSIEAVLPEMLRRGSGHLAAVSSLAAYKGMPGESAYCASKAAVNSYMDGLRVQLRSRNIAVTTICPGFVKTPMTDVHEFDMPWVMSAEEAALHIVAALRRRSKVYNFPWQTTLLMKFAAWAPDWALARVVKHYTEKPPS